MKKISIFLFFMIVFTCFCGLSGCKKDRPTIYDKGAFITGFYNKSLYAKFLDKKQSTARTNQYLSARLIIKDELKDYELLDYQYTGDHIISCTLEKESFGDPFVENYKGFNICVLVIRVDVQSNGSEQNEEIEISDFKFSINGKEISYDKTFYVGIFYCYDDNIIFAHFDNWHYQHNFPTEPKDWGFGVIPNQLVQIHSLRTSNKYFLAEKKSFDVIIGPTSGGLILNNVLLLDEYYAAAYDYLIVEYSLAGSTEVFESPIGTLKIDRHVLMAEELIDGIKK